MSEPFEPPSEPVHARDSEAALMPIVVWAMAGACIGVGAGFTADMMGWDNAAILFGFGGMVTGGGVGWLAHRIDRARAQARIAISDARGRRVRPIATWVLAAPLGLLVLGLLWLVVIGTIRAETPWAGAASLGLTIGVASLFRPLWTRGALGRAVVAAESGFDDEATRLFSAIDRGILYPRKARAMARMNLGLLALRAGRLEEAAEMYSRVHHIKARPFACTGLALTQTLQGEFGEVGELLNEATRLGGRATQGEVDGVRLLVVLRTEGPADAVALGTRLLAPGVGSLFLGVLTVAHHAVGDEVGARALVTDELRRGLQDSGLDVVVPEIGTVMASLS
jgi:hypothetical protein